MTVRIEDIRTGGGVAAILGPTNTGKTWQAIQRMLRYRTGMMGLPLRLLAREVYDRVAARAGVDAVALVTGEERRIPRDPRYWICTVESMPVDRPVAFLCVDEVQLAAHRERGHVFTDRLLHARGLRETLFLGSDTVRPLLERILPTVRVERHDRFSRLSSTGHRKLQSLPPRSAVVAFTVPDVYALAEQLRVRHGGTAVVLGALSPRTRNAQVAMFQAGEVRHMVATDAIGMGLNLDLDHVAFASLRKFDGWESRDLEPAEVGQIAGRAGRWKRDGTFGTTGEAEPLAAEVVEAVEAHRFPVIRALQWRNSELEFSSVAALREALDAPPPRSFLLRVRNAEDEKVLEAMVGREEVAGRARGREAVGLLWQVCQVPDFRKTFTEDHVNLLLGLWRELTGPTGRLSSDRMASRVHRLDRTDGDIDTLVGRIAFIRTWTYVSHRPDWLEEPLHWQEVTREIEDRLSDALHERLAQRFVDRRAVALVSGGPVEEVEATLDPDGAVKAGGHRLGRLEGLRFVPDPELEGGVGRPLWKAVRRVAGEVVVGRARRLREAPDEEFEVDGGGRLRWDGAVVGRLVAGPSPVEPRLAVSRFDLLGPAEVGAVRERLDAWLRAWVEALLEPLRHPLAARLSPAGRGLVYRLVEALGLLERRVAEEGTGHLGAGDLRILARLGVRIGALYVFVGPLLEPEATGRRALLWAVHAGLEPVPPVPEPGERVVPLDPAVPAAFYPALGFVPAGPVAVRVDALEELALVGRRSVREGRVLVPGQVAAEVGVSPEVLRAILEALGFRVQGEEGWRLQRGRPRAR